ncbi:MULTISPECIES: glycosyltransferase family 4 protein [unclassified Ornithinimicrobium]|uniref:glycosyltransferase family 4 protein n=1 Tax=unclassified Ornithinimicrobium TaxID=2615080 RepID=UPI0038533922
MTLTLVVPDRPRTTPSGGDRYDASVASAWARRGRPPRVEAVPGSWPRPSAEDLRRLAHVLAAAGDGPVLVDGLVGSVSPEEIERSAAQRPTVVLVHSTLADGAGAVGDDAARFDALEGRALGAASLVVATSGWAQAELARRFGLKGVVVALPGTDAAQVAAGSDPPQMLTLAALTPMKNHLVLLAALHQVVDLPWAAVLVGPAPDDAHLATVLAAVRERGLSDRVRLPGALVGDALDRAWAATDLLVHPSRIETFGLVVTEAHAHGIPTVVGAGTGAEEALRGEESLGGDTEDRDADGGPSSAQPGAAVTVDAPDELALLLRRWLTDTDLRGRWRASALRRREVVPGWDRTVDLLDAALDRLAR